MLPVFPTDSMYVVYDVRHSFPETVLIALIPLALFAFGYFLYRQRGIVARFGGSSIRLSLFAFWIMLIGGGGALILVVGTIFPDIGLRIALSRGHYQLREGIVTNFVPGDPGDHQPETWTLHATGTDFSYSYSPSILAPGYSRTAAHGGLIRNGLRVRVWDVGGDIARLEITP